VRSGACWTKAAGLAPGGFLLFGRRAGLDGAAQQLCGAVKICGITIPFFIIY